MYGAKHGYSWYDGCRFQARQSSTSSSTNLLDRTLDIE